MKTTTLSFGFFPAMAFALALFPASIHAEGMNYQGRLTDNSGEALNAASASLEFNVWNHPTSSAAADKLWGPFTINADLLGGRFNVVLGELDVLNRNLAVALNTLGGTYIHITVTPQGGATNAALPRQQIFAAPKALSANEAQHAITADTAASFTSQVLKTDEVNLRVGVGTANPSTNLHVASLVSPEIGIESTEPAGRRWGLQSAWDGGFNIIDRDLNSNRFSIAASGNVGIGTTAPVTRLQITGGGDAGLAGNGYIVTGPTNGSNLVIDDNEIVARFNGAASTLYLNNDGGNVSIGNSSSDVTINGDISLSGKVQYNRDVVYNLGDKSTTTGNWAQTELNLSRWADNVHGCVMRLYLQSETDKSTRIREWHILFEQDGLINNTEWGAFRRLSFKALGGQEVNTTVGNPDRNGSLADLWNDGWVVLSTYIQNDRTGTAGGNLMYTSPLPRLHIAIHPHIVGRLTISDR